MNNKLDSQKNLKDIICQLEEAIIIKSGADVFSEVLKLIYVKLVDELDVKNNKYKPKFINSKERSKNIQKLFQKARSKWSNVFASQEKFNLNALCLEACINILAPISILDCSISEATDAFEYILPEVAKKKRGQYFTPEHVIKLMVDVLKPRNTELILDPACGSGGYLINSLNYIYKNKVDSKINLKNIYGIDADDKSIKIAQAIKIIAGDKYAYNLNKLDTINIPIWNKLGLKKHTFDCILTNPPFSGDITNKEILKEYELSMDENNRLRPRMDRHILFLERVFDLLKPGGRAAIILPQGVLNNKNMANVRKYLLANAQILAIISLDRNIFRPYTDTKTSIVFLRRWFARDNRLYDYPIFMAVSEKSGKDHLGRPSYKINKNEKLILDHDLDDITSEYLKFLKK